jgi:hypothetical protein
MDNGTAIPYVEQNTLMTYAVEEVMDRDFISREWTAFIAKEPTLAAEVITRSDGILQAHGFEAKTDYIEGVLLVFGLLRRQEAADNVSKLLNNAGDTSEQ